MKSIPQVKGWLAKPDYTYNPVKVQVDPSAIPEDLAPKPGGGEFQLCEVFPKEELAKVAGPEMKLVSKTDLVDHPEVDRRHRFEGIRVRQATCDVLGDFKFRLRITNGNQTKPYWTDSPKALASTERAAGARVPGTLWLPDLPGAVLTEGPWRSMVFCGRSTVLAEMMPTGGERSLRLKETQQVRALARALVEAVCGTLSQPSKTVVNNPRDVNMVYRVYGGAHPEDIVGVDFMPEVMGPLQDPGGMIGKSVKPGQSDVSPNSSPSVSANN